LTAPVAKKDCIKGNIPLEEVGGCWEEIVACDFVELLRDDVDWWFPLVIPPSD
jgi:hypothetical protein